MNIQLTRRLPGIILTLAGFLLATGSFAALRRVPFLSWIRDQSIIQTPAPTFALQYFRVKDFDANGVTFSIDFSIPNILDPMKVKVMPCDSTLDPNCSGVLDVPKTGYKVFFTGSALTPGATTITLAATGNSGGATAYTSFTLRWTLPTATSLNPPTIEALPNRAIQLNSGGTAKYSTMFVIGDVDHNGVNEDVNNIYADPNFTVTLRNMTLPSSLYNIVLTRMPVPPGYINQETPRTYLLEVTPAAGAMPGVAVFTVGSVSQGVSPEWR